MIEVAETCEMVDEGARWAVPEFRVVGGEGKCDGRDDGNVAGWRGSPQFK